MNEMLSRSIIGESTYPMVLDSSYEKLANQWRTMIRVRELGSFKTIVTFETIQDMEEALKHGKCLKEDFVEIRRWTRQEFCPTRRI